MDTIKRLFTAAADWIFRRRLKKVCGALKIEPTAWQAEYALHGTGANKWPKGRRTGKTTAVILRALVKRPKTPEQLVAIFSTDGDFYWGSMNMRRVTVNEWVKKASVCRKAGVKIPQIALLDIVEVLHKWEEVM